MQERIHETKFQGIFTRKGKEKLLTRNLTPGRSVYQERLVREGNVEYREWNPRRSKLAASLINGVSQIGLKPGYTVLYLGASTGTTVSHVSDIVGNGGFIFALDIAPRVTRELVFLAQQRKNIAPLLADASQPQTYASRITPVDYIYQDIAQRMQAEIFLKNMRLFLKPDRFGFLCVKARSIDIAKKPRQVFREVHDYLAQHVNIVDKRELEPYERDHCVFVVKNK
ncbi:fibrillarin-like rRNA/tRNA 2'-O-methyltransferase [Candidatus Woesearchaeota archaeon]|nr:fibrillarin-like rRNA/tRNA 2'-O-methyltransferase [Candidatus Woesearchaeota archaeon]